MLLDDDEVVRVNRDRPGDAIYPEVKEKVQYATAEEKAIRDNIVHIIVNDMVMDLAVATAVKDAGAIVTYLAQELDIPIPEFKATTLMDTFSRISKLKLSLDYATTLGLDASTFDSVREVEIKRIGEGRWEFSPTMDVKLKHNIKPSKLTTEGMISFFKSLVKKFPSHDTFEVLKGDKPYHYQTPQLKKAQQKSLLKLVKSKYTIVVASRS